MSKSKLQGHLFVTALFSSLLLTGCSLFKKEVVEVEKVDTYKFVAIGYATMSAQTGATDDIKMLNAIKASKLEAYKELAEQVYGVMLSSENSVQQYQLRNDGMSTKVKGLVRGAKVLRSYHEKDLYITELGLNMETLPYLKSAEFTDRSEVIKVPSQIYY
ncbi:LPP20 family lipoprotein [Psychromonas sp. GE-S-Ul-11]|uniref:LPP20 family lipoprotein n=1 Tax=Psychromonas sp. GE-S-Ul-11 TaxID=3241170 RepID=UPI00390C499C